MDQLVSQLRKASRLAVNPMLLPILINSAWASLMANEFSISHFKIQEISSETGLMEEYLKHKVKSSRVGSHGKERQQQAKHNEIHGKIVNQHAYLCSGLSGYVKDDGEAILARLKRFDKSKEKRDLQNFMECQIQNIRSDLQLRDRLLGRLKMQLQVVRIFSYVLVDDTDCHSCILSCSNVTVASTLTSPRRLRELLRRPRETVQQ